MWLILGVLLLIVVLCAGGIFLLGRQRVWRPAFRLLAAAKGQAGRATKLASTLATRDGHP